MLLSLGAEAHTIDLLDDFAQVVAVGDLVADLAEDFTDLVLDRIWSARSILESRQIGEQVVIDKLQQVIPDLGILRQLTMAILRCGPAVPAIGLLQDRGSSATLQQGHGGAVVLQAIEVFEEQQPGGLLGVVELGAAAGLLAQAVVDGAEGRFEAAGCGAVGAPCSPRAPGGALSIRGT